MLVKHALAAISVAGFSFFAASAFPEALTPIAPPVNPDSAFTLVRGGHGGGGGHAGFGGGIGGRGMAMGGFSRGPMLGGANRGFVSRPFVSRPATFRGQRFFRGGRFHGHRRVVFRHGRRFVIVTGGPWWDGGWDDSCYWNCRSFGHSPGFCRANCGW